LLLLPLALAAPDINSLAASLEPEVAALREWSFSQPVTRSVLTVDQLKARMAQEEVATEQEIRLLKALGMVPESMDLDAVMQGLLGDQIGGFYDPESRELVLVDRGDESFLFKLLLAHELAHALDDQYIPLQPLLTEASTWDRQLVARSLIEGSATASMLGWMMRGLETGSVKLGDVLSGMSGASQYDNRSLYKAPSVLALSLVYPYMAGMSFLIQGHTTSELSHAGWLGERVLSVAKDLPASMEQVLHPEKYFSEVRDMPVELEFAGAFSDSWQTTLGELGCLALMDRKNKLVRQLSPSNVPSHPACSGWGGDRYLQLNEKQAIWATVWDTTEDRDEFLEGWGKYALPGEVWGATGAVFWAGDKVDLSTLKLRQLP
jgi:hypothetical protein